jgi:hypothetical protein
LFSWVSRAVQTEIVKGAGSPIVAAPHPTLLSIAWRALSTTESIWDVTITYFESAPLDDDNDKRCFG